jgi:hypothetical protein
MPTENRINADKGTPDEIVEKKVKVKATNEPEMNKTEGIGEHDLSKPTGDADDALLGNK